MTENAEEIMLDIDGEQHSLADIAGLDTSEIEEVRGFIFPKGLFTWKVVESELNVRQAKGIDTAVIAHKLECVDCIAIAEDLDAAEIVGKNYVETFWLGDIKEGLGQNKAFMVDSGFTGSGVLQELLNAFAGHEFNAKVKLKPDANDKSIIYANLDRRSVTPIVTEAVGG